MIILGVDMIEELSELGHHFVIPGSPIPRQRARHSEKTHRTYDPQYKLIQPLISILSAQKKPTHKELQTGPLKAMFIFFMPIPKSRSKGPNSLKPGAYHSQKPDKDNLEKTVMDLLQKADIYKNDSQIAHSTSCKIYSIEPSTHIYLKKL